MDSTIDGFFNSMDMALSYFYVILPFGYTLICVVAALLCLRLLLWPFSLGLATLTWVICNASRHYYWQVADIQTTLTRLLNPVPVAELLLNQRLGAQLYQQLKLHQQLLSALHLAQVTDDFLDELRASKVFNNGTLCDLHTRKMPPASFKKRLQNARDFLVPVQKNLMQHMQVITWFVLAISAMLVLIIPFTTSGWILYVGIAWLVMSFSSLWRIHQERGFGAPLWSSWSQLFAADLSQQIYHLPTLFQIWQHGKLRQALDNALDYQWISPAFRASLATQLLMQLMHISQQTSFGTEQQIAMRDYLCQHFSKTSPADQRILFAQITGNYWHILAVIILLPALLLTGMAFSYFE